MKSKTVDFTGAVTLRSDLGTSGSVGVVVGNEAGLGSGESRRWYLARFISEEASGGDLRAGSEGTSACITSCGRVSSVSMSTLTSGPLVLPPGMAGWEQYEKKKAKQIEIH